MGLLKKYIVMFRTDMKNAMSRRCGLDELNCFILLVSFIYIVAALFIHKWSLVLIGGLLFIVCCLRIFSKKMEQRLKENAFYMKYMGSVVEAFRYWKRCLKMMIKTKSDAEYAYFVCKTCGQIVRVPKGRNKVNIRCPKCNTTFIKRT